MADIKIYGKLVANTEDQIVADASSIQDTARNQKLSVTLNELAQGTGLKVLEVNLNNYLSQDGLLALIQGINYASIGDAISYQFSSSIAVDSSYNAVHVTASVSGQGGIDLYLLKSINEKFSCETLVSDGYNSKYKTIQNATLITSGGYIRGIVVTNSLVGNLCDLVNGRSELTSTKLTYWFPVGVLPTHIKLANDIIIDLQGNEYCAIGNETVDAEISNRVYLNVVKIDINGDFSNVSANDVKVVDFLWHHIENPSNFSFDDLPRFSDSSDVDDFPGSSGGGGSQGGSGKLYEFKFNLQAYDINGDLDSFSITGGANNITTLPITIQIYESNWEKVKAKLNSVAQMMGLTITVNTPQDLVSIINSVMSETQPSSSAPGFSLLYYLVSLADKSDLILVLQDGGISVDMFFPIVSASFLGKLYIYDVAGSTYLNLGGLVQETGYEYIDGLNVNNSCTLTEYGTSASGGDTPSSESTGMQIWYFTFGVDESFQVYTKFTQSDLSTMLADTNSSIDTINTMMSISLNHISSFNDIQTLIAQSQTIDNTGALTQTLIATFMSGLCANKKTISVLQNDMFVRRTVVNCYPTINNQMATNYNCVVINNQNQFVTIQIDGTNAGARYEEI